MFAVLTNSNSTLTKFAMPDSDVIAYKSKSSLVNSNSTKCLFSYAIDFSDDEREYEKSDLESLVDEMAVEPHKDIIWKKSPSYSATALFYDNQQKAAQERRLNLIWSAEQKRNENQDDISLELSEHDVFDETFPEIFRLNAPLFSKLDLIESVEAMLFFEAEQELSALGKEAEVQRSKMRELSRAIQ
jgi:hypothetical protein